MPEPIDIYYAGLRLQLVFNSHPAHKRRAELYLVCANYKHIKKQGGMCLYGYESYVWTYAAPAHCSGGAIRSYLEQYVKNLLTNQYPLLLERLKYVVHVCNRSS